MRYRLARLDDVAAMARIRAAEWGSEEYWETRIAGYLGRSHLAREALAERELYVADDDEHGNTVAGFVAGHLTRRLGCSGELEWISVAADYRKAGVARELLLMMVSWFAEAGALRVCVDPDDDARGFYLKLGAKPIDDHWLVWEDIRVVRER